MPRIAPTVAWLHPLRLLGALISAGFVLAAAAGSWLLLAAGAHGASLPAVLGGVMAFNTLLFFATCELALHPRRFPAILAVNVAPIPIATLLYGLNPLLADLVLVLLAPAAVFARAHGPMAAALATIAAINTLVALLFAGAPDLARLSAECGVIGTVAGFAADATAVVVLRAIGLSMERQLLVGGLARFLADLTAAWSSKARWPAARLSAHAARVQGLVADLTLAATAARMPSPWPSDVLPPMDLVQALNRSAGELHDSPHLQDAKAARVLTTLEAMTAAANAGSLAQAAPAVQALREAAASRNAADNSDTPAQFLGVGLLLSDVVQASRLTASVTRPPPAPASPPPRVRLMPDAISARLALQAGVCMVVALVVMRLLPFPKPYWLPLTTFILVSSSFGESARKSVERILGTGAGLIAGQLIWIAAAGHTTVLAGVVAVSLFGLFLARTAAYRVLLFWLTVMLSLVLHMADVPLDFYAARLADTLVGTCIVLIVTGLLLPVRTDDLVRARVSALLALGAGRLRDAAAALRTPGPHNRAGMLGAVVAPAQALRDLAAAEDLENGLLRRPRGQPAQRQEAIDRLLRVLLYVDQMLPVLSAAPVTEESLALLNDMATATLDTSRRIKSGTPSSGFTALHHRTQAQKEALAAAFANGAIGITQLEAERRLMQAMDGLRVVLETLEATMAPRGSANFRRHSPR